LDFEKKAFAERPQDTLRTEPQPDDPPPFLTTWPRVYLAVVVYLALLIFVLYLLTRNFAPPTGN
jgi:hypothetical protein